MKNWYWGCQRLFKNLKSQEIETCKYFYTWLGCVCLFCLNHSKKFHVCAQRHTPDCLFPMNKGVKYYICFTEFNIQAFCSVLVSTYGRPSRSLLLFSSTLAYYYILASSGHARETLGCKAVQLNLLKDEHARRRKKEPAILWEALLDVLFQSSIVVKYGDNLEKGIQQSLGKHKFSPESEKDHYALILCKVYKFLLLEPSIIK